MQQQPENLPAFVRLDPLRNLFFNSVYNALEENAKYARLAWFYALLVAPILLGAVFLFETQFAGLAAAGRPGLTPIRIALLAVVAGYGIAIFSLGLCHLRISDLRTKLRRADSEEALLDEAGAESLAGVPEWEFVWEFKNVTPPETAARALAHSRRQATGIRMARFYVQSAIAGVILLLIVALIMLSTPVAQTPTEETPAVTEEAAPAMDEAPTAPAADPAMTAPATTER